MKSYVIVIKQKNDSPYQLLHVIYAFHPIGVWPTHTQDTVSDTPHPPTPAQNEK